MSVQTAALAEEARQRLLALMAAHGAARAAHFLGISPQTFDRAIGGLTLHPWTLQRLYRAIDERNAAGRVP
jgi:hypothetical protein